MLLTRWIQNYFNMLHCYSPQIQFNTLIEKILPTLISVFVVVLLFIIGRYIERYNNKKEFKRNWYYKVIIEPNIKKIEQFIDNLFAEIQKVIPVLISASTQLSHKDYLIKKTQEFDKIKKSMKNFELDFIILFKKSYPKTEEQLRFVLFDIQDDILNILDDVNLEENDFLEIEKKIKEYKAKILEILHNEIE